ncbi:unnamed protein product [Prunus brigantina]
MMKIWLENMSDESRTLSLYRTRSSCLYSSLRADLTNLPSPPNQVHVINILMKPTNFWCGW